LKTEQAYPSIAREGRLFLILSFVISLVVSIIDFGISWLFWLITLFVLQFFRDPPRNVPQDSDAILSAADGKVISIEKTNDPYQNKKALKISVFMNVFNVHSNKSPCNGKVLSKYYFPGKFLNAALAKASIENERCAIVIETKNKAKITCVQIAGLIARRIICYKNEGDHIESGERYGFIRFGSRVDHYLPVNAKVNVVLGQKVKNVETILAFLK
jgi:phosphatidylserine decarboxylase